MKDFYFDYEAAVISHGRETADAARRFYTLYTGRMVEWIGSIWDKETGGFYFSPSARDTDGYYPDIESTGQALGVLQDLGLTPDPWTFPEPFRTRAVNFLRELQDEDGFFYHPQWGKDINTSRRARDLASATLFIEGLGSSLKYPSALEQMKAATENGSADSSAIPEHLRSEETFISYLDSLEVNRNSYSAGQTIAMQAPQIAAVGLGDVCIRYLNEHQLDNGIWESELNYATANGMLKICHAYNALGADLPRLDKVVDATITTVLAPETPKAIVDVFNPLMQINYLRNIVARSDDPNRLSEADRIIASRAVTILDVTREKLSIFALADGSFAYYPLDHVYGDGQWSQGKIVAPACTEGNMNATQLANASRILIMEALAIDPGLPYTTRDGEKFFSTIILYRAIDE